MYSIWQGVLSLQEGINDYMERIEYKICYEHMEIAENKKI